MSAYSRYRLIALLWCFCLATPSFLAASQIKGTVYDIAAPGKGLPLVDIEITMPDGKKATFVTNGDGAYVAQLDVTVGVTITATYHCTDYGVAGKVFVLDKDIVVQDAYLAKNKKDDQDYWNKAVEDTKNNVSISSWTGGESGLWKSADSLGVSTLGKIYLSRALSAKNPAVVLANPEIKTYGEADPATTSSFAALVQASLDKFNRLPTEAQVMVVTPQVKALPQEVIADVFGTKLTAKPDVKHVEVDQLGQTWNQEVKNKTVESLFIKANAPQ
jgi:hypothetical protein